MNNFNFLQKIIYLNNENSQAVDTFTKGLQTAVKPIETVFLQIVSVCLSIICLMLMGAIIYYLIKVAFSDNKRSENLKHLKFIVLAFLAIFAVLLVGWPLIKQFSETVQSGVKI
ncbi:Mbov_0395 family pilin-like conjugal transfer protein [Mesomycoplasma neurolyticum]|uniref:Uncharacterized protein n=1 Tax=Mesomycoplasma neurolyticum TaxID=2120 RepID=A0A449A4W9_9BACT|nr:hypothetical protein [Mesomycoplasma neurolyticum]VEU59340.1 Uncharacterised protein [Mesomycoplasma neurolyticum]